MLAEQSRHPIGALPQLRDSPCRALIRPELGRNLTLGLVDALGRDIVTGRYDQKAFPTGRALTQCYGISLSVAREAVKMLTAKGLLSARPRQGTMVERVANWNLFDTDVMRWLVDLPITAELLEQFDQLRVAIEPEAAALAARRADPEDARRIAHCLARLEAGDEVLAARTAFHVAVLQASANPFYLQFRELASTGLLISARLAGRLGRPAACFFDYARAGAAILARDPDAAAAAMRSLIIDNVVPDDTPGAGDRRAKEYSQ